MNRTLLALVVVGCAAPTRTAAPICLTPSTPVVAPAGEPGSPTARLYPGADDARTEPRHRYPTAVLLFAPPRGESSEPLEEVATLSFQPIVCVVAGALLAGEHCGRIMPPKATVRLTTASSAFEVMEVQRSATPFVTTTDDGPVNMPAPYAPACCMYKQCRGRTIPYVPVPRSGKALVTTQTVLAVWPADAEIDLAPRTPETDVASQHTWKHASFARQLLELATSDLDHDGHAESIVYELWANDYGLDVFVEGKARPIHAFGCGNI